MKRRFLEISHLVDIQIGDTQARIDQIRAGVPALFVDYLSDSLGLSKARLCRALDLPAATLGRKLRTGGNLPPSQSERVIGVQRIVQEVGRIVEQSGDLKGFNAAAWVGCFLQTPLPALGGREPADYLDTLEGQLFVANLIRRSRDGVYS